MHKQAGNKKHLLEEKHRGRIRKNVNNESVKNKTGRPTAELVNIFSAVHKKQKCIEKCKLVQEKEETPTAESSLIRTRTCKTKKNPIEKTSLNREIWGQIKHQKIIDIKIFNKSGAPSVEQLEHKKKMMEKYMDQNGDKYKLSVSVMKDINKTNTNTNACKRKPATNKAKCENPSANSKLGQVIKTSSMNAKISEFVRQEQIASSAKLTREPKSVWGKLGRFIKTSINTKDCKLAQTTEYQTITKPIRKRNMYDNPSAANNKLGQLKKTSLNTKVCKLKDDKIHKQDIRTSLKTKMKTNKLLPNKNLSELKNQQAPVNRSIFSEFLNFNKTRRTNQNRTEYKDPKLFNKFQKSDVKTIYENRNKHSNTLSRNVSTASSEVLHGVNNKLKSIKSCSAKKRALQNNAKTKQLNETESLDVQKTAKVTCKVSSKNSEINTTADVIEPSDIARPSEIELPAIMLSKTSFVISPSQMVDKECIKEDINLIISGSKNLDVDAKHAVIERPTSLENIFSMNHEHNATKLEATMSDSLYGTISSESIIDLKSSESITPMKQNQTINKPSCGSIAMQEGSDSTGEMELTSFKGRQLCDSLNKMRLHKLQLTESEKQLNLDGNEINGLKNECNEYSNEKLHGDLNCRMAFNGCDNKNEPVTEGFSALENELSAESACKVLNKSMSLTEPETEDSTISDLEESVNEDSYTSANAGLLNSAIKLNQSDFSNDKTDLTNFGNGQSISQDILREIDSVLDFASNYGDTKMHLKENICKGFNQNTDCSTSENKLNTCLISESLSSDENQCLHEHFKGNDEYILQPHLSQSMIDLEIRSQGSGILNEISSIARDSKSCILPVGIFSEDCNLTVPTMPYFIDEITGKNNEIEDIIMNMGDEPHHPIFDIVIKLKAVLGSLVSVLEGETKTPLASNVRLQQGI